MNKFLYALALLFSMASYAEVAVIVHPSNASNLDANAINRIFTGKEKSFSNGNKVIPISQEASQAVTEEFNQKVLNKSSSQLKAYWSKLVFTGKGTPPKEVADDAEVIKLVAANPDTIGFISASAATDAVKVVQTF